MTDKCSICLEEMVSELGVALPCGHCYHQECFARLTADTKRAASQTRDAPKCCVCKRKVKKFHKIYLNVVQCCPVEEKQKVEQSIIYAKQENARLSKRLSDLQSLSNDQSDMLVRILPRCDKLESRCSHTKQHNRQLRKQVEELKEENRELLLENQETKTQLDEAIEENMDLYVIWDTLEDQLEQSRSETKVVKQKLKSVSQELEQAKRETKTLWADKKRLRAAMAQSRGEVNQLGKLLKKRQRKKRRFS